MAHGLVPKIVTQQPGPNRLQRLIELIQNSVFSIHDLSYLKRDRDKDKKDEPLVPRFNMPFELGLVLGASPVHEVIILERQRNSIRRSLSDVDGVERCHYNISGDILRAISNTLFLQAAPDTKVVRRLHEYVTKASRPILRDHKHLFGARAFQQLVFIAQSTFSSLQLVKGAA